MLILISQRETEWRARHSLALSSSVGRCCDYCFRYLWMSFCLQHCWLLWGNFWTVDLVLPCVADHRAVLSAHVPAPPSLGTNGSVTYSDVCWHPWHSASVRTLLFRQLRKSDHANYSCVNMQSSKGFPLALFFWIFMMIYCKCFSVCMPCPLLLVILCASRPEFSLPILLK